MTTDADIAILGAGCAGLSLAVALAEADYRGSVLLLEPRREYTRDRTWCFWNAAPHSFEPAISHSWASWRVSAGQRTATRAGSRYRYCHIPADAFYNLALGRIGRAPQTQLCRGVHVCSLSTEADGRIAIETDRGRILAKHVFDSRPPSGAPTPVFLQSFLGWHVRTDAPCFDPATVELMQFLPSDTPGRIPFMYVLPFAPDEALVEMTYLDSPLLPEPPYTRDLEAWLRERTSSWHILYTEQGALPMGGSPAAPPVSPNLTRIGIAGGRLKPSSGYGFLRIQRHSRVLAQALKQGRPAPPAAESPLYGWMDSVFLRALEAAPERAPALFLRMFARSDPDALVRFLSERSAGPSEIARVAWSLPKLPMLRAALNPVLRGVR